MRHPVLAAARHRFRCAAEQLVDHIPCPSDARALGAAGAGADAAAGARADAAANITKDAAADAGHAGRGAAREIR